MRPGFRRCITSFVGAAVPATMVALGVILAISTDYLREMLPVLSVTIVTLALAHGISALFTTVPNQHLVVGACATGILGIIGVRAHATLGELSLVCSLPFSAMLGAFFASVLSRKRSSKDEF